MALCPTLLKSSLTRFSVFHECTTEIRLSTKWDRIQKKVSEQKVVKNV